eukprot:864060_1
MLPLDGDTFLCSGGLCPVELCIVAPETIIHCDVEPVKPENVEMMDEVGYDDMDSSPSKKKELRMVPINTARRYVGRVRLFRQVLRTLHHPEVIQRSKQRLQVRWTQTKPSLSTEQAKLQKGEGCRLRGFLRVNKVPGNFHISAHAHRNLISELIGDRPFNVSHSIRHMSFGGHLSVDDHSVAYAPLNGIKRIAERSIENSTQRSHRQTHRSTTS